jgi:hypothetical protein
MNMKRGEQRGYMLGVLGKQMSKLRKTLTKSWQGGGHGEIEKQC